MRYIISLLLICFLFVVVRSDDVAPEKSMPGIVDITSSNQNEYLDGSKDVFVEFYAPWCGHCKNLAPELHRVGQVMEKFKPKDVVVAKVNCVDHQSVCSKFGVQGYPTLKFFPKGTTTPKDYQSGRSAEDIINYVRDETGARIRLVATPSAVVDVTPGNFDDLVGGDSNVLLEFYAPWCGHCKKLAPDYEKVAETFERESNCVVAKVDADKHRSLAEKFDVKGFPTIKFFPKGSQQAKDYTGGRSPEDFIQFLNEECGVSRQLGGLPSNAAGIVVSLNRLAQQFTSTKDEAERSKILDEAKQEATGIKNDSLKRSGQYYVKVMESILKKGEDYPNKEHNRLSKMRDDGRMKGDQLDWLQVRLNVLGKFSE